MMRTRTYMYNTYRPAGARAGGGEGRPAPSLLPYSSSLESSGGDESSTLMGMGFYGTEFYKVLFTNAGAAQRRKIFLRREKCGVKCENRYVTCETPSHFTVNSQ